MKKIFAIITAATISASLFAFDFGGALNSLSKVAGKEDDLKFNQKTSLSAWLRTPFDEEGNMYLAAEGNIALENNLERKMNIFTADIALLKFNMDKKIGDLNANFSAGRFFVSDLTGKILSQNSDGLMFSLSSPFIGFSVYAGYTGLLNAQNVSILNGVTGKLQCEDEVYKLADKFVVMNACLSFPNLFANQTPSVQFLGTFGLEDEKAVRLYGTAGLSGPLGSALFYNLNTTLGMRKSENLVSDMEASNLTNLTLSIPVEKIYSLISVKGTYASGEKNGKPFVGFTSMTACHALSQPELSGITKFGFSLATKYFSILSDSVEMDIVFNSMEETFAYMGFQYGLSVTLQPKSDISFSAALNRFAGKDSEENKLNIQLGIILTF